MQLWLHKAENKASEFQVSTVRFVIFTVAHLIVGSHGFPCMHFSKIDSIDTSATGFDSNLFGEYMAVVIDY